MKVLLTGAAGFVGRRVAEVLEGEHDLRLLDSVDPEKATVFVPGQAARQVQPLRARWPYVRAEVTDETALRRACEGMDALIHLAAITDGLPAHGKAIMEVNAVGTYVVLDAARLAGVKRVLCASSINAFGTFYWRLSGRPPVFTALPLTEDFPPVPEDPYSLSKLVNEETCAAFHRAYGLTTAAFRFAGVWAPGMYEEKRGRLPPTERWADDLYQWVHLDDVAAGLKQALEHPRLPGCGVYTLSAADTRCPEPTMELLRRFRPDLAKTVTEPLEGRAPLLSIGKAARTFAYAPRHRLKEG